MKYDLTTAPLGSVIRAKAQLANLDLLKALKTCRNGKFGLDALNPELGSCMARLYSMKSYGVMLSGLYLAGEFGQYSVKHLLELLYANRDFPTLLKQAYRFDIHSALKNEIDEAIGWHASRGLPDAEAWRRKFAKIREQELLSAAAEPPVVTVEEELADTATETPKIFELRPLQPAIPSAKNPIPRDELLNDPYIVSRTARAKVERANLVHQTTLQVLKRHLEGRNIEVSESKLMDAYAVLHDGPAIFEVKSLTESNERDQIRYALSQLYEYRFLHRMADASLWIVFSQPPSSQWYID